MVITILSRTSVNKHFLYWKWNSSKCRREERKKKKPLLGRHTGKIIVCFLNGLESFWSCLPINRNDLKVLWFHLLGFMFPIYLTKIIKTHMWSLQSFPNRAGIFSLSPNSFGLQISFQNCHYHNHLLVGQPDITFGFLINRTNTLWFESLGL